MNKSILRVGSYNIKAAKEVNSNISLLASDITSRKLDFVGLQEIDINVSRSGKIDIMKLLSEHTGYKYYAFAKAIEYGGGEYGTGILSRFPFDCYEVIPLISGKYEKRSMSHALLDFNGIIIDVFNTHLSYENKGIRKEQFSQLSECLSKHGTFILTGDFNTSDLSEFEPLQNTLLANDGRFPTFPSDNDAIDNIVVSDNLKIADSGMDETGHSDHNMLWAEILI